jgi:hypothetical protein
MSAEAKYTLKDGRVVTRRPKGLTARDTIEAKRQVSDKNDAMEVGYALIARMIRIEGTAATYEDILDIELTDIEGITKELLPEMDFDSDTRENFQ